MRPIVCLSPTLSCLIVAFALAAASAQEASGTFVRGDCNNDGDTTAVISDAIESLRCLFLDFCILPCAVACDADDDGSIDITDAVFLLNFGFLGGRPPPPPFPECGVDPTPGGLRCDDPSPACEDEPEPVPYCPQEPVPETQERAFLRGDVNGDRVVDVVDTVVLVEFLAMTSGTRPPLPCFDAADTNDDGCVDLQDAVFQPATCPFPEREFCDPAPPFPSCGADPTADFLGCEVSSCE